jgi:hypothetical protein
MEVLTLEHERCFFCRPTPAGWPKGGTLLLAGGPCLSPASWAALRSWRPSSSIRPDGASMVLGPFAETKGPRLPGRNPAFKRQVPQRPAEEYNI